MGLQHITYSQRNYTMTRRLTTALLIFALSLMFSTSAMAKKKARTIDTVRSAPITLLTAIQKVEERMNGQVFEIELKRKSRRDVYNMWLVVDANVYEIFIDVQDGTLIEQTLKGKKPVRLGNSLAKTIQIAIQHQPGVAYRAECKRKSAKCEIGIITDSDMMYDVTIDGNTGDLLSIELD